MSLAAWGQNRWTFGQYSLFRFFFGAYLAVHFAQLIPWGAELFSNRGVLPDGAASPLLYLFPNVLAVADGPAVVVALLGAGFVSSLCFAFGCRDRLAAVIIWYALTCVFGRNPLIANPALPFVSWILLAHALIRRDDRERGQAMPPAIFVAAWIVMALAYSYSGYTKLVSPSWVDGTALRHVLENPMARPSLLRDGLLAMPDGFLQVKTWSALAFELLFAPLAFFRKLRPWVWLAMLGMHFGLLTLIDFADLSLGMIFLHWFTFNPAWMAPKPARSTETIFYDGHCGLCHGFVNFTLQEEPAPHFSFAPLQGSAFLATVPAERRAGLPDSVVVLTDDGQLLVKSAAVRHVLARLGGTWRVLAALGAILPTGLLDFFYDRIARIRKKLFATPADVCPMVPPGLRSRFRP